MWVESPGEIAEPRIDDNQTTRVEMQTQGIKPIMGEGPAEMILIKGWPGPTAFMGTTRPRNEPEHLTIWWPWPTVNMRVESPRAMAATRVVEHSQITRARMQFQ
jgi:hypothetical protein